MLELIEDQIVALYVDRQHELAEIELMVDATYAEILALLRARGYLLRVYGYSRNRCVGAS